MKIHSIYLRKRAIFIYGVLTIDYESLRHQIAVSGGSGIYTGFRAR